MTVMIVFWTCGTKFTGEIIGDSRANYRGSVKNVATALTSLSCFSSKRKLHARQ